MQRYERVSRRADQSDALSSALRPHRHVEPGAVEVRGAVRSGPELELHRRVSVEPDHREQLTIEVDNTPITQLLLETMPIHTVVVTGDSGAPQATTSVGQPGAGARAAGSLSRDHQLVEETMTRM